MPKSKTKRRKKSAKGHKGAQAGAGSAKTAQASAKATQTSPKPAPAGAKAAPKAGKLPWGGKSGGNARLINIVIAAAVALGLVAGGVYWGRSFLAKREFMDLAAQGAGRLDAIETQVDHGGGHLNPGETYVYSESIPTSGRHDPIPASPAYYEQTQRQTKMVHALEHGNIIIYYSRLDSEAEATVRAWTGLYTGTWDGVLAVPLAGLGEGVVLAAWNKLLRLDKFDAATTAAFIERFRGRGPENPVR